MPFHEFQDFTRKRKDYEKLLPTVMTMIGFFSEDPLNVLQRVQQRFELETIGSAGLLLAVLFKEHPEQCLSFVSTLLKPSVEPAVETKQSIPRISLKELPAKFQNVREANVLSLLHELLIKYHNERVFKYHEDEKPRLRISEPRLFKISVTLDGKVIGESNFEKNKKVAKIHAALMAYGELIC